MKIDKFMRVHVDRSLSRCICDNLSSWLGMTVQMPIGHTSSVASRANTEQRSHEILKRSVVHLSYVLKKNLRPVTKNMDRCKSDMGTPVIWGPPALSGRTILQVVHDSCKKGDISLARCKKKADLARSCKKGDRLRASLAVYVQDSCKILVIFS